MKAGHHVGIIAHGAMLEALAHPFAASYRLCGTVIEIGRLENLPYILNSDIAGMNHIGCIETVITQVVHHNLKGREISHKILELAHHIVYRHSQCGLAQRVHFEAIGNVTNGTHREQHAQLGVIVVQPGHHGSQSLGNFINTCQAACELMLRHLVAVAHHLASVATTIHHSGSQGNDERVALSQVVMSIGNAAVHALNCGILIGHRESGVEIITAPHPVGKKQVGTGYHLSINDFM